jgi:hypothetical protein
MDIKQAKTKLASISGSTASKHPKVLVSELCTVVKFLLDEIDRIKTPTMTTLKSFNDLDQNEPIHTPSPDYQPPRQRHIGPDLRRYGVYLTPW